MTNIVSILRTARYDREGIKDTTYRTLDLIDFQPPKNLKNVSIKINLCYYWDYTTGETTDPRVVSSVIDYIRERWNRNASISIVESDASAVRMKNAFKMLGYEELATEKRVSLLNLSDDHSREVAVSAGGRDFIFDVPQTISDSDIFITIPKPKYHITGITCALKNQFGCNPVQKKSLYHPWLNETIVALNKIMKPHIVLVDGVIVPGVFPKKLGLMLGSTDPVAADYLMAQIMGLEPRAIAHIKLAIDEKVGTLENISIKGENIKDLRKEFPKKTQPSRISRFAEEAKLGAYAVYLKLSGNVPLF